jgi:hypothetical protein
MSEFENKKRLYEAIKNFNRTEQEELFRIIKKQGEEFSENRNGIFFDLMIFKPDTITKIKELVDFCNKNNSEFKSREDELDQLAQKNPGITE